MLEAVTEAAVTVHQEGAEVTGMVRHLAAEEAMGPQAVVDMDPVQMAGEDTDRLQEVAMVRQSEAVRHHLVTNMIGEAPRQRHTAHHRDRDRMDRDNNPQGLPRRLATV